MKVYEAGAYPRFQWRKRAKIKDLPWKDASRSQVYFPNSSESVLIYTPESSEAIGASFLA